MSSTIQKYQEALNILKNLDQDGDQCLSSNEIFSLSFELQNVPPEGREGIQSAAQHLLDESLLNCIPDFETTYEKIKSDTAQGINAARSLKQSVLTRTPVTRIKCENYYIYADCDIIDDHLKLSEVNILASVSSHPFSNDKNSGWIHSFHFKGEFGHHPLTELAISLLHAIEISQDIGPGAYESAKALIEQLRTDPELIKRLTGGQDIKSLVGKSINGNITVTYVEGDDGAHHIKTKLDGFQYKLRIDISSEGNFIGLSDPNYKVRGEYRTIQIITQRNNKETPTTHSHEETVGQSRSYTEGTRSTISPVDIFGAVQIGYYALKVGAQKLAGHMAAHSVTKSTADEILLLGMAAVRRRQLQPQEIRNLTRIFNDEKDLRSLPQILNAVRPDIPESKFIDYIKRQEKRAKTHGISPEKARLVEAYHNRQRRIFNFELDRADNIRLTQVFNDDDDLRTMSETLFDLDTLCGKDDVINLAKRIRNDVDRDVKVSPDERAFLEAVEKKQKQFKLFDPNKIPEFRNLLLEMERIAATDEAISLTDLCEKYGFRQNIGARWRHSISSIADDDLTPVQIRYKKAYDILADPHRLLYPKVKKLMSRLDQLPPGDSKYDDLLQLLQSNNDDPLDILFEGSKYNKTEVQNIIIVISKRIREDKMVTQKQVLLLKAYIDKKKHLLKLHGSGKGPSPKVPTTSTSVVNDDVMKKIIAALKKPKNYGRSMEKVLKDEFPDENINKTLVYRRLNRLKFKREKEEIISDIEGKFLSTYGKWKLSRKNPKGFTKLLNYMRTSTPGEPIKEMARKLDIPENRPAIWYMRLDTVRKNGGFLSPTQKDFLDLYKDLAQYNLR